MKRFFLIFLSCLSVCSMQAKKDHVSRRYNDVSLAAALKQLDRESPRYVINFMYDELEDFRVTTSVKDLTVPDAIRQMIGHYPISMTIEGDSAIYVECTRRESARFKGIVVDENGKALEFANVTLLSPVDSTTIGNGVTTASGRFVIPYQPRDVLARVTYVGYKATYRRCHNDDVGTIKMEPDNFALGNVTVTGSKSEKPKKVKKNRRGREHVIITLNDSSIIDGYLVSDIQGDKIRIYRNGLNPRVIHIKDIRSLMFTAEGDSLAVEYIPVMVIDEYGDDKRAKLRLLTRVYDSDYLSGYSSPATDYYTYETSTYSAPSTPHGVGTWHTHTHQIPFSTRQYYYQVKGNAVAMPYWQLSWSPHKPTMKYHMKKIFRHFPSIINTVNGPDFDSKAFFERPETLLPVLDQALQEGSYQAIVVVEDQRAVRADKRKKIFDTVGFVSFFGSLLLMGLNAL